MNPRHSMAAGMELAMAAASSSCSSPAAPPRPRPSSSSSSSRRCLLHIATTTTTNRPAAAAAPANLRRRRGSVLVASALPETAAASVLVAGLVGVAATLLRGKQATPLQQQEEEESEECSACGGTGLCPRCKGEGFVFKELPEETASRARKAAKNMATRKQTDPLIRASPLPKMTSLRWCQARQNKNSSLSLMRSSTLSSRTSNQSWQETSQEGAPKPP